MPSDARLGDVPHLQALRAPEPRLDLRPRHVLQRERPPSRRERVGRLARGGGGAALVHVGFAAAFFFLLSFRDAERPREVETPVEVVVEPAKPAGSPEGRPSAREPRDGAGQGAGGPAAGGPAADPSRPSSPSKPSSPSGPPPGSVPPEPPQQGAKAFAPPSPAAPAPPPPAPAPAGRGAAKPAAPPAPPPPAETLGVPKLVAPPPDAARAATQDRGAKPANLVPDEHQADAAAHEARPVAMPRALVTVDPRAESAVAAAVEPQAAKADRPTPPVVAKAPSETDKLAAALPMDTTAMPMSFRAVLAGNAAAQTAAAYNGIVQGRLDRAKQAVSDAAFEQALKGGVSLFFTLDDAGNLADLGIVQSSGDPRLDALALQWIRSAAPFPPPPAGAERTYRKALIFGH